MRVSRVADIGLASSGEPAEEFPQGQGVFSGRPRRNGLRERADIMNEQPGKGEQNPGERVNSLHQAASLSKDPPQIHAIMAECHRNILPPPPKAESPPPGDLTAVPLQGQYPRDVGLKAAPLNCAPNHPQGQSGPGRFPAKTASHMQ